MPKDCNAFRIQRKVGNGRILMGTQVTNAKFPGSLCLTLLLAKYNVKLNKLKQCRVKYDYSLGQ